MGWQQNVFSVLIIEGGLPGSGLFVYSGPPAFGNLVYSIAAADGTDPYGNTVFGPGATSYDPALPGDYARVTAASILLFAAGQFAPGAVNLDLNTNALALASPIASGTDTAGFLKVLSETYAGALGQAAVMIDGLSTVLTAANPADGTPEVWHTLGSPSATGYTSVHGRYRLKPDGETEIDIQLQANSGGGTAGTYTYANTLPADYRALNSSAGARSYPLGYNGTVSSGANFGCVLIDDAGTANAGRVRIQIPALPANTVIGGNVRLPLN